MAVCPAIQIATLKQNKKLPFAVFVQPLAPSLKSLGGYLVLHPKLSTDKYLRGRSNGLHQKLPGV
jgi:hypothetical protein